jgi:hypothetical protein
MIGNLFNVAMLTTFSLSVVDYAKHHHPLLPHQNGAAFALAATNSSGTAGGGGTVVVFAIDGTGAIATPDQGHAGHHHHHDHHQGATVTVGGLKWSRNDVAALPLTSFGPFNLT